MSLPCQISSSENLEGWANAYRSLIVRITYSDGNGQKRRQMGALLKNDRETVLLGVGNHRPVFYWQNTGRNSILMVEAFDLSDIADLLHHNAQFNEAQTYYTPPWDNSTD